MRNIKVQSDPGCAEVTLWKWPEGEIPRRATSTVREMGVADHRTRNLGLMPVGAV